MSLYALASAGGAPGVTTSALALALGWPSRVIIAECDPSGGDILAGLFGGHLPGSDGLLSVAVEAARSAEAAEQALWGQLIDLDEGHSRQLLAGISDPRQAAALAPSWPALAAVLAAVPADVIADCGRLDAAPATAPVLAAAELAVLVLRPSLRQVSKARQRAEMLAEMLGGRERLALLLVGEGSHTAREVSKVLGFAVLACLPQDRKTAGVLSDGEGSRRALAARPLLRAGTAAARALREAAAARQAAERAADPGAWREPAGPAEADRAPSAAAALDATAAADAAARAAAVYAGPQGPAAVLPGWAPGSSWPPGRELPGQGGGGA